MSERDMSEARDAALTAALREAVPRPPHEAVDWSALHGRITADAVPVLRRRRSAPAGFAGPLLDTLAGWAMRGVPAAAALAASILLLLSFGVPRGVSDATAVAFVSVEEELAGGLFDGSAPLVASTAGDDELLEALVLYQGGER